MIRDIKLLATLLDKKGQAFGHTFHEENYKETDSEKGNLESSGRFL